MTTSALLSPGGVHDHQYATLDSRMMTCKQYVRPDSVLITWAICPPRVPELAAFMADPAYMQHVSDVYRHHPAMNCDHNAECSIQHHDTFGTDSLQLQA